MWKKLLLLNLIFWVSTSLCFGAIVEGTNAGFVTSAPTDDPSGADVDAVDNYAYGLRFTSPAATVTVTEIGWWCDNATEEANFEVGIYSHDAANERPNVLLASNKTNAKGTTAGWKTSTVSYTLSASTIYWLAVQLDDTTTTTNFDYTSDVSYKRDRKSSGTTTLPDPTWGLTASTRNYIYAIYAVYTAAPPAGVNIFSDNARITGNFLIQ